MTYGTFGLSKVKIASSGRGLPSGEIASTSTAAQVRHPRQWVASDCLAEQRDWYAHAGCILAAPNGRPYSQQPISFDSDRGCGNLVIGQNGSVASLWRTPGPLRDSPSCADGRRKL